MNKSHKLFLADAEIPQLRQKLPGLLPELLPAGRVGVRVPGGEAALAGDGINVALSLQLVIGPLDGVGIDGQLRRQGPDRRKFLVGADGSGDDQLAEPVLDLLVDGAGVPVIEADHRIPSLLRRWPPRFRDELY